MLQEIQVRVGGLRNDPIGRGVDFFWINPLLMSVGCFFRIFVPHGIKMNLS